MCTDHMMMRIQRQACVLAIACMVISNVRLRNLDQMVIWASAAQAADRPAKSAAVSTGSKPAKPEGGKQDDQVATDKRKVSEEFVPPVKLPTKKIKLADGIKVEVEDYGDTYQGYDFRPPMICHDWDLADPSDPKKGLGKRDRAIEVIYDSRHPKVQFKSGIHEIAVDSLGQKLYVTVGPIDPTEVRICRMNLDGTHLEHLTGWLRHIHSMTVDHDGGKVYFATSHDACRMNLDGSRVEKLVTDMESLRGITVDPEAGHLYMSCFAATRHPRIFRSQLDGSNRMLFLENAGGNQLQVDSIRHKLWWNKTHVNTGKQISCCNLDGTKIEHLLDIGMSHWFGGINALELDANLQKLYVIDTDGGSIRRMNCDGTQPEELVYGNPGGGVFALDSKHGYMYWTQYFMIDALPIQRILRTKIPASMRPVERPAPPLVTDFSRERKPPEDLVTVAGRFLNEISHVAVVGVGTGEYLEAKHRLVSDTSLEVVVPRLKEACSELALILQGPGGVTVTLPRSALTYDPSQTRDLGARHFDAWAKHQKFSLVINSNCEVTDIEHCLAYVAPRSFAIVRNQGQSVLFLKDGAITHLRGVKHSIVFQEPFAVIHRREMTLPTSKLISVPAIRPSFVDQLLTNESSGTSTPK